MYTTVNGHDVLPGCHISSSAGWRGIAYVVTQIAGPYGFHITQQDQDLIDEFLDEFLELDAVVEISDEAEEWLNTKTGPGFLWHWTDGDFFLSPFCENDDDCADDFCACRIW